MLRVNQRTDGEEFYARLTSFVYSVYVSSVKFQLD